MADTQTIFQALVAAKKAVGAVGKNEKNTMQNFNFRGIDSVVNACAPAFIEHGIVVTPEVIESNYETVEVGAKKTPMGHVTVVAKYVFWGPAGDSISSTVLAEAFDSGDKACAKAMSVAYRIALLQTLSLPTTEPDPDSESYERGSVDTGNVTQMRPQSGKPADWGKTITGVKTLEALRKVWKEAGAAGALQDKITVGSESLTVQEYLYRRSDDLGTKSSANSS